MKAVAATVEDFEKEIELSGRVHDPLGLFWRRFILRTTTKRAKTHAILIRPNSSIAAPTNLANFRILVSAYRACPARIDPIGFCKPSSPQMGHDQMTDLSTVSRRKRWRGQILQLSQNSVNYTLPPLVTR